MIRLRFRKRIRLGPATLNIGAKGWTSTTWRVGPFSFNSRRTGAGVDLPGGLSADLGERRRR